MRTIAVLYVGRALVYGAARWNGSIFPMQSIGKMPDNENDFEAVRNPWFSEGWDTTGFRLGNGSENAQFKAWWRGMRSLPDGRSPSGIPLPAKGSGRRILRAGGSGWSKRHSDTDGRRGDGFRGRWKAGYRAEGPVANCGVDSENACMCLRAFRGRAGVDSEGLRWTRLKKPGCGDWPRLHTTVAYGWLTRPGWRNEEAGERPK